MKIEHLVNLSTLSMLWLTMVCCQMDAEPRVSAETAPIQKEQAGAPFVAPEPTPATPPLIQNWKTHKVSEMGFQVRVPVDLLTLSPSKDGVLLHHAVPYVHVDPCDERDEPARLDSLVDFKVRLQMVNASLGQTLRAYERADFTASTLREDRLQIEPGFIDSVRIGTLKGYQIFAGAHGCGEFTFYFPLNSRQTLLIKRAIIPELTPIHRNYLDCLALPGVIKPEQERAIFEKICASFEFFRPAPVPVTYKVVKVAGDDVLNVRAGVGTRQPILGTIPSDGRGILITGEGRQIGRSFWVPVKYNHLEGWVNRGYLAREDAEAK